MKTQAIPFEPPFLIIIQPKILIEPPARKSVFYLGHPATINFITLELASPMKHFFAIAVFMTLVGNSLRAEDLSSFQGKWSDSSDPKTCEIPVGYTPDPTTVYLFSPRYISYYEIECLVQDVMVRSDGADINLDCFKGGGSRYFDKLSIRTRGGNRLALKFNRQGGNASIIYRCPDVEENLPKTEPPVVSEWMHNGSMMTFKEDSGGLEIDYLKPRAGLYGVGVRPDTMLFVGSKRSDTVEGKAYLFDVKCGPVAYSVEGRYSNGGSRLVMYGMAPRTNSNCDVVKEVPDALVFDRVR